MYFGVTRRSLDLRGAFLLSYQQHFLTSYLSHRKKREAKIKRDVKRGIREANEHDPFEIFITVTDIRYTCVPMILSRVL